VGSAVLCGNGLLCAFRPVCSDYVVGGASCITVKKEAFCWLCNSRLEEVGRHLLALASISLNRLDKGRRKEGGGRPAGLWEGGDWKSEHCLLETAVGKFSLPAFFCYSIPLPYVSSLLLLGLYVASSVAAWAVFVLCLMLKHEEKGSWRKRRRAAPARAYVYDVCM